MFYMKTMKKIQDDLTYLKSIGDRGLGSGATLDVSGSGGVIFKNASILSSTRAATPSKPKRLKYGTSKKVTLAFFKKHKSYPKSVNELIAATGLVRPTAYKTAKKLMHEGKIKKCYSGLYIYAGEK